MTGTPGRHAGAHDRLLQVGHVLQGAGDPEVATGHHHRVGPLAGWSGSAADRRRRLHLGDEAGSVVAGHGPDRVQVGGRPDEGDGQVVDLRRPGSWPPARGRRARRARHPDPLVGQVDAGPALRPAAGDTVVSTPSASTCRDGQLDASRPRARPDHRARGPRTRLRVLDRRPRSPSEGPSPGHQAQAVAFGQERPTVRELAGPDLGPREVGQYRDRPAGDGRSLPHEGQPVQVVGHLAVAEVQAEHVDARIEQRVDLIGRLDDVGPMRRHDLRVARHDPFLSHPAPRGRGRADRDQGGLTPGAGVASSAPLACLTARMPEAAVHRVPVRFPRRLALAVPRGGQRRGRVSGRGRLRRLRRGGGLGRRRRSCGYVARGGALVAWRVPAGAAPHAPVPHRGRPHRLAQPAGQAPARHRERGLAAARRRGLRRRLVNSWLDRDLGLSGRLVLATAAGRAGPRRPAAGPGPAARHPPRPGRQRARAAPRQAAPPDAGLGAGRAGRTGELAELVAGQVPGLDPDGIAAWDLMLHDLTPPALPRADRELIASARLDNLCSSWAAVTALGRRSDDADHIGVVAPLRPRGGGLGEHDRRRRRRCWRPCSTASCSPAAARPRTATAPSPPRRASRPTWPTPSTPTTPSATSPATGPLPNAGPVLKVNANQRYATDAVTAALFTPGLPVPPACRGRCSSPATRCPAGPPSGRSPPPASASPPSTSAARSCPCTRPASCAAPTIPAMLVAALGAYLAGA